MFAFVRESVRGQFVLLPLVAGGFWADNVL